MYRRTLVAASDRLHVIIAAFTEGAAPAGLQLDDSDKVSRHFSTIGIEGVGLNTSGMSADDLVAALEKVESARPSMLARLVEARKRLHSVRAAFAALHADAPGVREEAGAAVG